MKKLEILIVEDEALIAKDIEISLRQLDYSIVGIAYDSVAALDMIHSRNPDLVLLDIELNSEMTGIDIAKVLNDKYKIPFIYLTSFSDPCTIDAVKKTLPFGYILKPFSERELYSAIELASFRLEERRYNGFPDINKVSSICILPMTAREYDLLVGIFAGKTNLELAAENHISINTVKTHLKNIYYKMDASNRHTVLSKIYKLFRK